MGRKFAEVARIGRVGDVDEGGSEHAADQRVLVTGHRVRPAPNVVERALTTGTTDLGERQERLEIDVVARERFGGQAVDTGLPRG